MKKILIAYTTNAGSTEDVARAIGEEFASSSNQVDVQRLETVSSLDDYDMVIVGAPMILGWHREAVKFVKKHQQALAQKKVAYFCTAMSLTQTGEMHNGPIPVCVDEEFTKPPKDPNRLGIKERYALLQNYLRPMINAAPAVKPLSIGVFGGKLELFRLKWWQMLFVMVIIQAQPGDLRNWPLIRQWAAELCAKGLEA